ncbi:conserved hypothetical protein [Leishmania mexicana MHOM/GT/2001/U1103]|uniref:Uncharacterized protein n=1 Tax=Leishmania mexicana (strain MHOM/GT/2001/U1103) TaxID=929439 RepID=E9APA5_LEIMU|nr:conserved hypothetical protein [Leishmania mexicana MHOM/GT/2001/U1103]CBZ24769.1 conserved hypothetical protein [Leishmania mexicana MHOM/GT/2001/U1103]
MKRNGHAASPAPRSFDELKSTRLAGSKQGGSSVTVCGKEASSTLPLVLDTDSGRGDNLLHGSDQTPCDAAAGGSSIVANNTPRVTKNSPTYPRNEQQPLLPPHGRSRGNCGVSGKSQEPSVLLFESPVSVRDGGAQRTLQHHTTASDNDDARYPQAELSASSPHSNAGVPASVLSPSVAAVAAGARAAGAAVPFLFSLKLPPATVTHLGVGRASGAGVGQSCDSLSESVNSACGVSLLHGRNRITGMGEAAASSGHSSPLRVEETTGTGVDSEHHSQHRCLQRGLGEGNTNAAVTTPFLRDAEPLPASEAWARNRLPSGTHIRRRPRSVVRQHTGAAGTASIGNGTSSMMMLGDIESASSTYGQLDGSVSGSNALATSYMRHRGAAAAFVGGSASRGGVVNRVGTGRTRDVLPQGTRSGTVTGGAVAAGYRRRADPSPAPSRPPRSRRTRAGASSSNFAGTPSSATVGGPTFSLSSPTQFGLRAGHQTSIVLQAPKRILSEQSSPGASSPLNFSLERGSFFLTGDKDSLAASSNAAANHQHPIASSYTSNRSDRSGAHSAGRRVVAASTKPPSGRRQGSLGRVLAPVQHSAGASHVEDHGASSPWQDYAKLATTYMKLCVEVGDEPNMDWVAGLSLMKGGERQHDMLPPPTTLSSADAKECTTNHSQRVPSALNGSLAVSGHFLRSGPQQQQQHTPRGGVRPRIATGAAASSLSATTAAVETPTRPPASSVSQRASTPAGRRTKSPAARHGASSASSPSTLPKRSGSVGRITSVNRPSIFGSSTQQLQHTTTVGESIPHAHGGSSTAFTSSAAGVETAMADVYAQQVAKYCAEHLQPFADNMKSLQEQRAAVALALQTFLRVAHTSLSASAAAEKSGGEEAGRRTVVSVRGQHHSGHSNRGLGSGKGGGAMTSTSNSSTSTTPRKPSISRNSTASSLTNTATSTTAGHMSRRASAAAAAAAKAASLSDALQTLQTGVVTLLNTLSDGVALAQVPANNVLSSPKSVGGGSAPLGLQATHMASGTITNLIPCTVFHPDESTSGRVDNAAPPTAQTGSPVLTASAGMAENLLPSPALTLPGAGGMHTSQAQTSAVGSSTAVAAAAARVDPAVSTCAAPSRFVEFVRAQRREVAGQLDELCDAVRHALGSPVTTPEAAVGQRPTVNSAGGAAATPVVLLEASNMLSTPFFVPPKCLNSLAIAMAGRSSDNAAAEKGAAVITDVDAIVTSPTLDTALKFPNVVVFPKSASSASWNKLKSSKLSSSGGGSMTGRSSVSSTPRARVNGMAMPYAPLFTFSMAADDDEVGDVGVGEDLQAHSTSGRSTEGTAGNAYVSMDWYLLRCVQPSAAAGAGAAAAAAAAAYSPRLGMEREHISRWQNSTFNWSTTELSSSLGSTYGGGAATGNVRTKRTTAKTGSKRSASVGAGKSGRTGGGGGGGGIYQSRPALSTSQKAPSTAAPAGPSKPRKKLSAASLTQQEPAQQEKSEHLQLQQQLVKAWTLWTALQPLVENRDDVAGAGAEEPPSYLPQPSSASASVNAPAVVGGSLRDCPLTEEDDTSTPPMMSTPTAAATPVAVTASPTQEEATPDSGDGPIAAPQLPLEADDEEPAPVVNPLQSPPPPPPLGTLHSLSSHNDGGHLRFEEHKEDDDVPCHECSFVPVRVADSIPSLSSLQGVPRRLNMDDTALLTHSDGDSNHVLSAKSSAATFLYSSMEMPQRTAPPQSSVSGVDDESSRSASAIAPTRAAATDTHMAAACRIAVWWAVLRDRLHAVAQRRKAHLMENATQREKVLAARRNAFVRLWVCRWRLRRYMEARKLPQQASAPVAPTAAGATEDDDSEKTRRTAPGKDKTPASTTTTVVSASRERFQRAKEQRKAALASATTVTPSMARLPASSSSSSGGAKDAALSVPIRVPPLPLAASGISTFAIRDYHGESSSFTVSAMHRLLNAPPSLLYATCMVALRYPTNAPMAYLDNSGAGSSAAKHCLNGSEERQKSEAPPAMDERCGGMAGSDPLERWRRSWQTMRGSSVAHPLSGSDCNDDDGAGGRLTAQQRRWIETGLLYIRFHHLRQYVCGKYEALIPASGGRGLVDEVLSSSSARYSPSSLDATLNSATRSYRGSAGAAVKTALPVPLTMRYESIVDPNELQHAKPVVKPFHRPFEQWGMAYSLTSRVFCAAAIYAWQLIFSHTPFDDAKQRELPTREEQQARLERVADRNGIILDCYGMRSEREWLREATKDLSFVGQIYLPNYDRDDPEQQRESRDNYDFVKNFLFQCFPSINKLIDIPDYLVGAGLFFVLKEVFHYTRDSPSTQRMHEVLPRLVVVEGQDHIAAVTPATSALAGDGAAAARDATQLSPAPSREVTHDSDGVKGLSGWQRAALQRYEQLRQLHHLSIGILTQEKTTVAVGSGAGAGGSQDKATRSKQYQQQRRSRSPVTWTTSIGGAAKDSAKAASGNGGEGSSDLANSTSTKTALDDATLPLRRCMANGPAGSLTPMQATPGSAALGSSLLTSPAALRDGILEKSKSGAGERCASSSAIMAPARDASVQLVRVPHRLLRPSAADVQFVRDFEEEVSKSIHGITRAWSRNGGGASLDLLDVRAALAAGAALHDALDIAYPRHFLVKLSETLSFELFGLQLSLANCEDLDSMGQ